MVSAKEIEQQLKKIGFNFNLWGRGEVRELAKVIAAEETVNHCVNGHYQGGFAMLVATNQRLLLIDRKPMFLTIEAVWYDKIVQVDYNHRLLNANLCIATPNKELLFTSWNHGQMRGIMLYTQERMTEAKMARTAEQNARLESAQVAEVIDYEPHPTLPASTTAELPNQQSASPTFRPVAQSLHFPNIPTPSATTLYAATRLPFSRRRYYAGGTSLS